MYVNSEKDVRDKQTRVKKASRAPVRERRNDRTDIQRKRVQGEACERAERDKAMLRGGVGGVEERKRGRGARGFINALYCVR